MIIPKRFDIRMSTGYGRVKLVGVKTGQAVLSCVRDGGGMEKICESHQDPPITAILDLLKQSFSQDYSVL